MVSQKMDISNTDTYEWELDRMFSIWNSAKWEISNWIQVASNHRSTVILNMVYKAFFHYDDFIHWGCRLVQNLLAIIMLAIEITFERALYLYNEGYKTGADYDIPQTPNKSTCINVVPSVTTVSLRLADYQKPMIPIHQSTPKQRTESPHFIGWSADN